MRKITAIICCVLGLTACDKHDPILPGTRTAIFDSANIQVANKTIDNAPETVVVFNNADCPYTQDASNVIWDGDRKIFSGFPTSNSVKSAQRPVCSGNYVYAGLTTGELVKVAPKSRQIAWVADIYRASNLTGGAPMVDIVAPIIPVDDAVFVGGLGDAFCKISAQTGAKKWCLDISVPVAFTIAGDYAFVVGADKHLYAIETGAGEIYWRVAVDEIAAPEYANDTIRVDDKKFAVRDGAIKK